MNDRDEGPRRGERLGLPSEGLTVETLEQIEPLESKIEKQPAKQTVKRREMLNVHLQQLKDAKSSGAKLEKVLLDMGLSAWELARLDQGLSDSSDRWHSLVAEGVAFRNKYETDLGWAPSGQQLSVEDRADSLRILTVNAAIGIALLEETQRAVNQLILCGELEEAKKLTVFRNRIAQGVNDLKLNIGKEGFSLATTASTGLIVPDEEVTWTEREKRAVFMPGSRQTTGRVLFKAEAIENNVKPLLMVLGVVFAAWAVFILPRVPDKQLPPVTLQDVPSRVEIRHIESKPPSLFVRLDSYQWLKLAEQDRLALINDVGRTAAAAGYQGAHFTLDNGKTAAKWLRRGGSRLAE